jgi:hypothetical protein
MQLPEEQPQQPAADLDFDQGDREPRPRRRRPIYSPEPWCYGFLTAMAYLNAIGGISVSSLGAVGIVLLAADNLPPAKASEMVVTVGVWWASICAGLLTLSALMLLAVDGARNIRAMRMGR